MSQIDTTVIAGHCVIKGELQLDGPTVIAGRVEGTIFANDALEIAAEGVIEGDIHGVLVDIQGTVKGNVIASRACRLAATARVAGELRAANLAIAEGACFVGQVHVGADAAEQPLAPAMEPAADAVEEINEEMSTARTVAGTINRLESLTHEAGELAMAAATAQPISVAPTGPTVRVLPQAVQNMGLNSVNRAPKIIKAR